MHQHFILPFRQWQSATFSYIAYKWLTSGGVGSSNEEFCLFNINFGKGSSSESSRTSSENRISGLNKINY